MGSARNHLLDEFIADYMGIISCWQVKGLVHGFYGPENYPGHRTKED